MRKAGLGMFLVFFLLGFSSIIIQTTLIREFLVVFEGNELCLGGIFGIWFLWIMIGAPVGSLLSKWVRNVGAIFVVFVILGALSPFAQIYAIRIVRDIFDVPMSLYVSFPEMLLFALICVAPFSFMIGVTFPLGVKVYTQLRDIKGETKGTYVPPPLEAAAKDEGQEADISLPEKEISEGLDAAFGLEEPPKGDEAPPPDGQAPETPPPAEEMPGEAEKPSEGTQPEADGPAGSDTEGEAAHIGWIYVLESLGFLAGGVFFTFVLVNNYMPFLNAAVVFGVLSLLCFLLDLNCFSRGVRVMFGIIFLAITVERVISATPLDEHTTLQRWRALKLDLNFIESADSKYENLAVGQSRRDEHYYSVFGNGAIMFSFPEPYDLPQVANTVLYQHPNPKTVLLIGNGSHGLIRYMLMHPLDKLVHVELDPKMTEVIGPYLPGEDQAVLWGKRVDEVDASVLDLVKPHFPGLSEIALKAKRLCRLPAGLQEKIKPKLTEKDKNAFGDPRFQHVYGDGRYYVKTTDETFDLVFANVPDPSSAMINRYYTTDFYEEVKAILNKGGVFAGTMSSAVNYIGDDIGDYAGSLFHTLRDAFEKPGGEMVITPGEHNYVFACLDKNVVSLDAGEEGPLVKRFKERGVTFDKFTKHHFVLSIGTEFKQKWLRDELMKRENVPRNTDMRPISYFYQLLIWDHKTEHPTITLGGKEVKIEVAPLFREIHEFDKAGFSIFKTNNETLRRVIGVLTWIRTKLHIHDLIVVVLALLALRLLYSLLIRRSLPPQARFNSLLSMAVCGFGSMVFSITLLFAFQNLYGFLYHMIGLITALFMFGLAMGGVVATIVLKRLKTGYRALFFVLLALFVYAIILPLGIHMLASGMLSHLSLVPSQICFMVMLALGGSLTGLTFPLASHIYFEHSRHTGVTAGLVHGADHGGACLGAFLSGTVFVPIMGLAKSCYLVAVIGGACLVLQGLLVLKERRASCRDS